MGLALLLTAPVCAVPAGRASGVERRKEGGAGWAGRHPEAGEVAAVLRRLRARLEREGQEAKATGHMDVAMECHEEVVQIGEMWAILEELNAAKIPLEAPADEL